MCNIGKKFVLLIAFALLAETGGVVQAQQPSFYWNRSWQALGNQGDYFSIMARNNQGQCDQSPMHWNPAGSEDENLLVQDSYLASVEGASAYGAFNAYYYLSDDNQPAFELGTDTDCTISGSVSSTDYNVTSSESSVYQNGGVFGEVILSSETGTDTTCRMTLDMNWVGTNNYPYCEWFPGVECHHAERWIYAYAQVGAIWLNVCMDNDSFAWVEGGTSTDQLYRISSTPLYALVGSLEVDYSELVDTVSVGEIASYEIDSGNRLYGFLPVGESIGPSETTSTFQTAIKIWADQ